MKTKFNCPVCESKGWMTLETYSMRERAVPKFQRWQRVAELGKIAARILVFARPAKKTLERRFLSKYEIDRQRIFRDIWGGGNLWFSSVLCGSLACNHFR